MRSFDLDESTDIGKTELLGDFLSAFDILRKTDRMMTTFAPPHGRLVHSPGDRAAYRNGAGDALQDLPVQFPGIDHVAILKP